MDYEFVERIKATCNWLLWLWSRLVLFLIGVAIGLLIAILVLKGGY